MLRYLVKTGYGESGQIATFYHSQDVSEDMKLTNWNGLTSLDMDKFVLMDDGSELYAKITYVSGEFVRTTGGTFRIKDIVHCAVPKYEFNGYSGANSKTEHFLVRPPSKNETAKVNQLMAGEKLKGRMTERVKVLSLEKMQEKLNDLGCDEDYLMEEIVAGITDRDRSGRRDAQWLNCVKIVAKVKGFDLEKPNGIDPSNQIETVGVNRFAGTMTTVGDRKREKALGVRAVNEAIVLSDITIDKKQMDVIKSDAVTYAEVVDD